MSEDVMLTWEECRAVWHLHGGPPLRCCLPVGHLEREPFYYAGHVYREGTLADWYEVAAYQAAGWEEAVIKALRDEKARRAWGLDGVRQRQKPRRGQATLSGAFA